MTYRYRNVRTGRVLERPTTDKWLEASRGWERVDNVDELVEPKAEAEDNTERTDTE